MNRRTRRGAPDMPGLDLQPLMAPLGSRAWGHTFGVTRSGSHSRGQVLHGRGQVLNYQFLIPARPSRPAPALLAALLPVVRVPGEDGLGAVELLGQERAAEQVRPGRGAEMQEFNTAFPDLLPLWSIFRIVHPPDRIHVMLWFGAP